MFVDSGGSKNSARIFIVKQWSQHCNHRYPSISGVAPVTWCTYDFLLHLKFLRHFLHAIWKWLYFLQYSHMSLCQTISYIINTSNGTILAYGWLYSKVIISVIDCRRLNILVNCNWYWSFVSRCAMFDLDWNCERDV